jgi:Protein of unknown function (DUF1569)
MKTVFDKTTRDELINRINTLSENSTAQWGKMNICQMVRHSKLWTEMILGRRKCKRIFFGRLIGKMVLKGSVKDDKPMMRNAVSSPELIVKENKIDFSSEKAHWISLIEETAHFSNPDFVHPFFGKMTKEQIGIHAYKHTDHHLRQFNS